ncbi:MAG: hypothetical protein ACMUIP_07360 [bacterium]
MNHTIKRVDNRLYRGYRIISGKEGKKVNDLLLEAIKLFLERDTREIKKYILTDDALEREIIIKNIPDDLFEKLNKTGEVENKNIDDIIINALYEYVFDKEVDYRKELLNIEEDEFH